MDSGAYYPAALHTIAPVANASATEYEQRWAFPDHDGAVPGKAIPLLGSRHSTLIGGVLFEQLSITFTSDGNAAQEADDHKLTVKFVPAPAEDESAAIIERGVALFAHKKRRQERAYQP